MKKTIQTAIVLVAFLAAIVVIPLIQPTGNSLSLLTVEQEGIELLVNPTLANNCSGWHFGAWRFLNSTWAKSDWTFEDGRVSIYMDTGVDRSFYCAMIEQPYHSQPIYDLEHEYIATWRGSMNSGKVKPPGALGMGVNFFLDAIRAGQKVDTIELYIFFYMEGYYELPIGTFKDYGYRGSYWFETLVEEDNPETWRYYYFHPVQLEFGKIREISFSLNRCLETVRTNAGGPFESADSFRLTRVMSVMEMILAEGSFSTEYVSLKQVE